MVDITPDKAELARRFAEEMDAIASRGAAPDCAERLAAFHAWFDAECTRMRDGGADFGTSAKPNQMMTDRSAPILLD